MIKATKPYKIPEGLKCRCEGCTELAAALYNNRPYCPLHWRIARMIQNQKKKELKGGLSGK